MAELLTLDLVDKKLVTDQLILTIGYDIENLKNSRIDYNGEITIDRYGRSIPKHAHGTINLDHKTSSTKIIEKATMELYDRIINKKLLTRRISLAANKVVSEEIAEKENNYTQINLFTNYTVEKRKHEQELQELDIKKKYGKNAILKGMNFQEGATTIERNSQIGGHKS